MRNITLGLCAAGLIWASGAAPAAAFDCAKAATVVEKAICADPALVAADAELDKAFSALKAQKHGAEVALLVANQHDWILQREADCRDDGTAPALRTCIADSIGGRLRYLTGLPETGEGTGSPLWPSFSREKGGDSKNDNTGLAATPVKGPADAKLNAAIAAFIARHGNGKADLYATRYVYGSPRLVSVHFEGAWEGSAHPMPWRGDLNFDVQRLQPFRMLDALPAEALASLTQECREQVREDMASSDAAVGSDREATFKRIIGDLSRWSFGAKEVVVSFDHGEISDYEGGDPECRFPTARINALTKAGFPKL